MALESDQINLYGSWMTIVDSTPFGSNPEGHASNPSMRSAGAEKSFHPNGMLDRSSNGESF
jgi:hypothetical protein